MNKALLLALLGFVLVGAVLSSPSFDDDENLGDLSDLELDGDADMDEEMPEDILSEDELKPPTTNLVEEDDDDDDESFDVTDEVGPSDLLEVDVDQLAPKTDSPKFEAMRAELKSLKEQLTPLHKKECGPKATWAQCHKRRAQNAQIIKDVMKAGCHTKATCNIELGKKPVNTCPKAVTAAGEKTPCQKKAEKTYAKYVKMRKFLARLYNRLYRRYVLLLAQYYRSKFRMLAKVFVSTVKRLRNDAAGVRRQNSKLRDALKDIMKTNNDEKREHAKALRYEQVKYGKLADKHAQAIGLAKKNLEEATMKLTAEKAHAARLNKVIEELNGALSHVKAANAKQAATIAKAEKDANDMEAKHNKLMAAHNAATAKLAASTQSVGALNALVAQLKSQVATLHKMVAAARARSTSAEAQRAALQTQFNALKNALAREKARHTHTKVHLSSKASVLQKQVLALRRRCIPDACGICGGDESSCATRRSRLTCYSVGDPHFRTFDGVSYDFQYDGQFILASHGQDFEVQTLQRRGRWWPRINLGTAMRGGRTVTVSHVSWSFNTIMVNGQQRKLPHKRWVNVGPGFNVYVHHSRHMLQQYCKSGKCVLITQNIAPWSGGWHQNVYVNAPWQWSSGRSMWGLCGDYDSYSGNDSWWISRWWQKKFVVTNTKADLFRFPHRRAEIDIDDDFTPEEIDAEIAANKKAGIADLSETETVQHPLPKIPKVDNADEAKKPRGTKAELDRCDKALLRKAEKICAKVAFGAIREQCKVDVCMGLTPRDAVKNFGIAEELGTQKMLKRCMRIDTTTFGLFPEERMCKPVDPSQGYSLSFWFNPDSLPKDRRVILQRGRDFVATVFHSELAVGAGDKHCEVPSAFVAGKWTAVTISLKADGGLNVFVNRKLACTHQGDATKLPEKGDLVAGGEDDVKSAHGRLAHLWCFPITVTQQEAQAHGFVDPTKCKR